MTFDPKKEIQMASKKHNADKIVTTRLQVDVLNAPGTSLSQVAAWCAVSEVDHLICDITGLPMTIEK
jgi:putative transposase